MSVTSTSDGFDFAREVTDAFVERRGRGIALSAADRHLVEGWESLAVPLPVVLDGIAAAFARRRDPPRSLKDCKRWVTAAIKRWQDAESSTAIVPGSSPIVDGVMTAFDMKQSIAPASTQQPRCTPAPDAPGRDPLAERVVAVLESTRDASGDSAVRAGLTSVLEEVRVLIEHGRLDAEAVHALDDVAAVAVHRAMTGGIDHGSWDESLAAAKREVAHRLPVLVKHVLAGTNTGGTV